MSIDPNPSPKSKIQNPKSKIQSPKSKIQNPKSEIQNPKSKIQNPKSEIRNPKSKRGRLGPPQKERRLNWSKIQNPKSEIRNPKSKIQNPKSKIQTPNSKIQTPKSKIQNPNGPFGVWILDFGFGRAGAGGDGHVANEDVWPCWPPELGLVGGHTGLQPKGRRFDSPHERPKLGTDFRRRGFAGNRGSISSPVFWKLGPSFRRNCKPGGAVRNVGLTSRGADHACKGKRCQHHVVFI